MRALIKLAAWLLSPIFRDRSPGIRVLIYHRVTGTLPFELDLSPRLFERQIQHLHDRGTILSLPEALELLQSGVVEQDGWVLTFDDGYEDFYTRVFPILKEWDIPATVYVTTGFVEGEISHPFSRQINQDVQPMSWDMVGELMEHPLITVGDHTRTHPAIDRLSPEQVTEEVERSLELFEKRTGRKPVHFAYPFGRWSRQAEAVIRKFFRSAAIGEGAKNIPETFHPYRLRRTPVRRSDQMFWFRCKVSGFLDGEEKIYDVVRKIRSRL